MKLSISNLAWHNKDYNKVLKIIKKYNFTGIEIAPTKIWGDWNNISKRKILNYNKAIHGSKLKISSIQSLFFNTNLLLEKKKDETKIIKHFQILIEIAKNLNCKNIVFGSPHFRKKKNLTKIELEKKLIYILKKIEPYLKASNVVLAIEPNPKFYGCNFINKLNEAYRIVKKVGSNNVRIQIDTACIELAGDNFKQINKYLDYANHIHLSEKNLNCLNKNNSLIKKLISLIKKRKWNKWVSIEMMNKNLNEIESSLKIVRNLISK